MMEDQNTGKLFKDAFDGYDSPFDADKIFGNIEAEIQEKDKPKRPFAAYFIGCSGLIVLALILVMSGYLFRAETVHLTMENSLEHLDSHENLLPENNPSRSNSQSSKNEILVQASNEIHLKSEDNNALPSTNNSKNQSISSEFFQNTNNETVTSSNSILRTEILKNQNPKQSNAPELIQDHSNLTKLFKLRNSTSYNPIESLLLGELNISNTSFQPFSNQLNQPSLRQNKTKRWDLSLVSTYQWTNKSIEYFGTAHQNWFDQYKSSEKLHASFETGLKLRYYLNDKWYILSSLNYLHAQESHTHSSINQIFEFDDQAAKIIYIDRAENPFDTIFGVEIITTVESEYYLVKNIRLLGHGLGTGYSKDLNSRVSLKSEIQFIYYLMQESEGLLIDPKGNLIDDKNLFLDGSKIDLNQSVYALDAGLSLNYRISNNFELGLSANLRYHLKDFSASHLISIKRNYLGLGLNGTYSF